MNTLTKSQKKNKKEKKTQTNGVGQFFTSMNNNGMYQHLEITEIL